MARFKNAAEAVEAADPSRPRNLSGAPNVGTDDGCLEIASPHYPGLDGVSKYGNGSRPTMFDEFIHLNCYNREEMVTRYPACVILVVGWRRCGSAPTPVPALWAVHFGAVLMKCSTRPEGSLSALVRGE